MVGQANPFALVRASDYTDVQINSLWVELGSTVISQVIEPRSGISKYILGGKGSGKTHLLRYHSYQVARLRNPKDSGIAVVSKLKFLAIFLRATALDAARFEATSEVGGKWQQLFGVYLELRLVEGLLDALCDIKATSLKSEFDDAGFLAAISDTVIDRAVAACRTIEEFRSWLIDERRRIDDAVNNAAFSGTLELRVPFSIGSLCLPVKKAISKWNQEFSEIPLIYLLDEIENFSEHQQQVVNSLIRYGEGLATFRVTGRLYARKTVATIGGGEENREGAEFKTTNLDGILKSYPKYSEFARKFVQKRLGFEASSSAVDAHLNPKKCFVEINSENYFAEAFAAMNVDDSDLGFAKIFLDVFKLAAKQRVIDADSAKAVVDILTVGFPLILKKLNLLRFCKNYKKNVDPMKTATRICEECKVFLKGGLKTSSYSNAYGHYKNDLFAQVCRESRKATNVPYAGFDTFISMSSGNPRNLLIVLGRAYEIAAFKELDFIRGTPLSIQLQTEAAIEAARFMYERDTNYGSQSDLARVAVERLALVLRTARYALNIPEVSPLAVSFSDDELTAGARMVLDSALNYSFVFEVQDGRPDRNSQRVMRKIQFNPLLSPKWGLPTARRGDLSLGRELVNAIFDPSGQNEFDVLLKGLHTKWNNPFGSSDRNLLQSDLF